MATTRLRWASEFQNEAKHIVHTIVYQQSSQHDMPRGFYAACGREFLPVYVDQAVSTIPFDQPGRCRDCIAALEEEQVKIDAENVRIIEGALGR